MIEGIISHYMHIGYLDLLEMPVIKIFDYLDWGVYFMNMEAYMASMR